MPTINYNFKIDGFWNSTNYYRSLTPMNPASMPTPTTTGIIGLAYSDATAETAKSYFVRFGSVKEAEEKISNELLVRTGRLWTPADLSAQIYLDADDLGAVDSGVATWSDRKNSFAFTQSTSGRRPIVKMLAGHKAALFQGENQLLADPSLTGALTQNKAFLWSFAVVRKTAFVGNVTKGIMNFSTSGSARFGLYVSLSTSTSDNDRFSVLSRRTDGGAYSVAKPSSVANITDTHLICGASNFAVPDLKLHVDGTLESSVTPTYTAGNTSNTAATELQLGASGGAGGQLYLHALFFGNTPLSDTDRQKLEGWSAHKYGLTGQLPIDHPYKYAPPVV